jgi:hypothetical protein
MGRRLRGGRLIARQLDEAHMLSRAPFEARDALLRQFPEPFSLPRRFRKHLMLVADLHQGDEDAIEDVAAAWRLRTEDDVDRPPG